jgi:hypothetical protein
LIFILDLVFHSTLEQPLLWGVMFFTKNRLAAEMQVSPGTLKRVLIVETHTILLPSTLCGSGSRYCLKPLGISGDSFLAARRLLCGGDQLLAPPFLIRG